VSLTPGTAIGAYRIVAHLGAGGMGEVYRAHDPRLARDVALKVLPADMAGDPARLERFTREARAIAALNHPHIVTIYSTEEAEGIRFITMELVDGESLDALIPSSGMPLTRFLELALPLADALNAAHQKQITHRDLKPANVMVTTDGRVKVLDFGLASAPAKAGAHSGGEPGTLVGPGTTVGQGFSPADLATSPQITTPGMVIGTMPYMSPEQVEGKTLDHRTDLFSLGVMFHEMLAGARPFIGASPAQLMSSILRDTPASVREIRPDLPEALDRLIHRCLEKRADDRVQTARDVFNELRHVQKQFDSGQTRRPASGAHPTVDDALWIAVLPFTVRGQDADAVVLADGLTEDITAGLTRFPSLSVVATQSALGFKGLPLDVRQIADRLNARYIVGGSVRRSATGTRVVAHLTDARSGAQLWTETYDRGADADLYAVQDEVTDRVVATIADKSGVLARSMVQAVRKIPLGIATSRQLVLRCWEMEAHPTADEHAELRAALESYVAIHPDDADIWAELSHLYSHEYWLGFNPLPDPVARAERAARRAIELDTAHQLGWQRLAMTAQCLRDEHGLAEAAERAIAINPRNVNMLARIGSILTYTGEYDRGCELTERAIALNPQHPGWYHFAFFNRRFARGEFAEALKAARRVNVPDLMRMHFAIAAAAGHLGLARDGAAAVQAMIARTPEMADDARLRDFVTRWYWDADLIERLLEGVRRSSPPIEDQSAAAANATRVSPSSTSDLRPGSTAKGMQIAVLPFTARAGDDHGAALADGITDDLTAGLSRFAHLRVVSRARTSGLAADRNDLRAAGRQLEARYLLEGSVRSAGTSVRISARLVEA
jgi:TolB-like protein